MKIEELNSNNDHVYGTNSKNKKTDKFKQLIINYEWVINQDPLYN